MSTKLSLTDWALHIEDIPKIRKERNWPWISLLKSIQLFRPEFCFCRLSKRSSSASHISIRDLIITCNTWKKIIFKILRLDLFLTISGGRSILLLDRKAESNWCKIPNWCFVGRRTDLNLHIYPSKFHLISQSQSPLGMKKVVLLCIPLRQHNIDRQNRTNSYLNSISLYGGLFVVFWPSFASDIVNLNSDFLLWWLCF